MDGWGWGLDGRKEEAWVEGWMDGWMDGWIDGWIGWSERDRRKEYA